MLELVVLCPVANSPCRFDETMRRWELAKKLPDGHLAVAYIEENRMVHGTAIGGQHERNLNNSVQMPT